MEATVVKSPCISVCVLNEADVCEGCYRSAQEITDWGTLDNRQKLEVLKQARRRFECSARNVLR